MLVLSDGNIVGTLGGGCAEAEVWQAAMRVMKTKVPVCGGTMGVFIEPIAASQSGPM